MLPFEQPACVFVEFCFCLVVFCFALSDTEHMWGRLYFSKMAAKISIILYVFLQCDFATSPSEVRFISPSS